ncbi:MAG: hypothetical protein EXX96DRAFT_551719 [Benjaminiella poitrasii]|nr:MAG: hypothetical protein EXX96DRAFT_551719 [Benjaminiella poitrasii]
MMDYQQRISELLGRCQNEWVNLDTLVKENKATPSVHYACKDLHEGIKQLVQLQDNLDEIGNIVENNSEWNKKADLLLEAVHKKLQFAANLTVNVKPVSSQSLPLKLSTTQTFKPINNAISDIKEDNEEDDDDDDDDEQFLDASEELPEPDRELTRNEDILAEDITNPTLSSSPSSSVTTDSIYENRPIFGRRSIVVDEDGNELIALKKTEKKGKSLFPLFKGLRPSQSTPVKSSKHNEESLAHINFFKNDNNKNDSKHFIFATDAMVDHPLRIGVGYGSYICYSCTILSDKGAPITVRKRYSDFVELREELVKQYPVLKRSIPKLPPKKVVGKFTPAFVEQRRRDLEYFFKYVVLHPTLGASSTVKHWIAP